MNNRIDKIEKENNQIQEIEQIIKHHQKNSNLDKYKKIKFHLIFYFSIISIILLLIVIGVIFFFLYKYTV